MPSLFIKDEGVNDLAVEVMKVTGAASKTEAVRSALQAALDAAKKKMPLLQRVEAARSLADRVGPVNGDYDPKADADDMWQG